MKKHYAAFAATLATMMASVPALAQPEGHEGGGMGSNAIYAIAAALTMALASAVGAISQSKAAVAALEGISRNPGAANKVQTPMIIALALIESLVIYALIIAFMLQGKIG